MVYRGVCFDDRLQLLYAFVPLFIEVCVFDDPFKRLVMCLFLGFLSGVVEVSFLLRCETPSLGVLFPTFR